MLKTELFSSFKIAVSAGLGSALLQAFFGDHFFPNVIC